MSESTDARFDTFLKVWEETGDPEKTAEASGLTVAQVKAKVSNLRSRGLPLRPSINVGNRGRKKVDLAEMLRAMSVIHAVTEDEMKERSDALKEKQAERRANRV